MYIIKNALKSISRSKARNFLIGIIVFVIATSSCIGLSIRQASENAKSNTLENMTITASISFDRQSMMNEMSEKPEDGEKQEFDRDSFKDKMSNTSSLTLEEYQTYAQSENVKDFYYTLSASFNGSDDFEPVSTEDSSSESMSDNFPGNMGGFGGMDKGQMNRVSSDFTVIGYSSENAMSDFVNGNSTITSGTVFEENTTNYDCIISDELATFNNLEVGDTFILTNPNNEDETYECTIVGTYSSNSSSESFLSNMGMTSSDPANQIYLSYSALNSILESSSENEVVETDDSTGREVSSVISGTLNATYVFNDVETYELFSEEVYELGLDESYVVSSSDISSFENSLVPLETLSTMAGWFLIVILVIGAIILIVLNIFNIRERKYEIGVLCAIGMKKSKVACQFIFEIFAVTMLAVTLGIGVGAVSSVPVTNALLENQVTSQSNQMNQIEQNFGRPGDSQMSDDMPSDMPGSSQGMLDNFMQDTSNYVTEIDQAMNFTVVLQMFGIALLLTLVSGAVSVLFVMRYEPLKILANRD